MYITTLPGPSDFHYDHYSSHPLWIAHSKDNNMQVYVLRRPPNNIFELEAAAIQYGTKVNVTRTTALEKGMLLLQMQP